MPSIPSIAKKPKNFDGPTFSGLKFGEYEIIILSSKEKEEWRKKNPLYFSRLPDATDAPKYKGAIRAFIINETSPDVIDLGVIELEPLP
jgi:hypothetical protein